MGDRSGSGSGLVVESASMVSLLKLAEVLKSDESRQGRQCYENHSTSLKFENVDLVNGFFSVCFDNAFS